MPRISKLPFDSVRCWATLNVAQHATDFTQALAAQFGVSRAAASAAARQLEERGYVVRLGGRTRPSFMPGPSRFIERRYALPGIDESLLWERDFSPWIDVPPNVRNILHYGFTEVVNNANDHSQGTTVQARYDQTAQGIELEILDDGVGVFRRIADTMHFDDLRLSLLELAKGKFTSDKANHSGEGLFFTSRAFDEFYLNANELEYRKVNSYEPDERIAPGPHKAASRGTWVAMAIETGSSRVLRDVFSRYEIDEPDDLTFAKTTIPVKLASLGQENLLSRSQAKRLVARIDQFRIVELDFDGVPEIGQAFSDEVFRVFANAHPQVQLISINANADVLRMIMRVTGSGTPPRSTPPAV